MKKYTVGLLSLLIVCLIITGCWKTNKDAIKFKESYQALNGKENKIGKTHRKLRISKNNPFVYATAEEILEKIENNETFYVYFGDPLCPWCRSVIEKAIEVAKDEDIIKIYYVEAWDDEGNEILRSKYELKEGQLTQTIKGTDTYYKLLEKFDSLLSEYTITDENKEKIPTGEKRIYLPSFFYIEKGNAVKMTDGISKWQEDPMEKLTKAILEDEEEMFENFFEID